MYWHGWPGDWDRFLAMSMRDTYYANQALDALIDQSNETGSDPPKRTR